ncbi:MAG: formylglycine-generating enzyme family protein [Planctomycetota bacterium]
MTAYRHVIFLITVLAFLAAFLTFVSGCVGAGYKAVESEGRDEATGLWKEIVHEKSGIVLRLVPAGEFYMGSPSSESGRGGDEGPVHRVKISKPFYIGKHEVTQEEWKAVMENHPSYFKGDNLPVETVSRKDAQEFCRKAGGGLRLPSEAEWEYACRAGSRTRWCFGDDESALDEYAWYKDNSGEKTHEVGKKKPNAWGLYDMHGNVYEYCEDLGHMNYNDAPEDGSAWTTGMRGGPSCRVCRGGSWDDIARYSRSAYRGVSWDYIAGFARSANRGFRVALSVR